MPIDFFLTGLTQTVQMGVAANMAGAALDMPTGLFDATISVTGAGTLAMFKNLFKFHMDSVDVNDTDPEDMLYYVFASGFTNMNFPNPMAAPSTVTDVKVAMTGRLNSTGAEDYITYLSHSLFGNPDMVDLFSNEVALENEMIALGLSGIWKLKEALHLVSVDSSGYGLTLSGYDTVGAPTISGSNAIWTDASGFTEWGTYDPNGNAFLSNEDAAGGSNKNYTRYILEGMIHNDLSNGVRFISGVFTSGQFYQSLPFIAGDSVSFLLNVNAADGQHLTVGGVTPIPVRTYLIKFVMS